MDSRSQCTATARSGQRCRRRPIPGATVCSMHGGSAPQVRDAARRRLLEAADPAAARLVGALAAEDDRVAVRAAGMILDRAGVSPTIEVALPGTLESVEGAVYASAALIAAVARGEVPLEDAARLQGLLAAHAGLLEAAELTERVAELERLLEEREASAGSRG